MSFFVEKIMKHGDTNNKEKSIWKDVHTPMKDRKTSSGITFWPKKVKYSEQK